MLIRRALIIITAAAAPTAAQEQLWIRQIGSAADDYVLAAASDGNGGLYAGGSTFGSFVGASAGDADGWFGRFDVDGNTRWMRQIGTSRYDGITALSRADDGGLLISGSTRGSLAGGAGYIDAFVGRYDAEGSALWLHQFGTAGNDQAFAVATDGANGAYVAGFTNQGGPGGIDAWIARYDSTGSRMWLRMLTTTDHETATALLPDGAGGAFISGSTSGALGGSPAGQDDVWVARYDSAGNRTWLRQFGSDKEDKPQSLAGDGMGGFYIAGSTYGVLAVPAAGEQDAWLARYDGAGQRLWIRQFGTEQSDFAGALAVTTQGRVLVGGQTLGDLAGAGSSGASDAFVSAYDNAGSPLWVRQFGDVTFDWARALAPDSAGGFFVAGTTDGSLPGPSQGMTDVWLARWADAVCPPDCDDSGVLDFFDFLCFQNLFAAGDPAADCDESGELDFFDFLCFQNAFAAGCP